MKILDDQRAAIYQGDALAVLQSLPDSSVDALVTDPPYSSGGMMRSDRTSATGAKYVSSNSIRQLQDFSGDNRDQRAYAYWTALWLSESVRLVKPSGLALVFSDWRQLPTTIDSIQAGGFIWRGIVPWYKPVARPMAGRFATQCEYVVWGSRGPMPIDFSNECLPGFYQASSPRERVHQTQKPLEIMRAIMQIVPRGGVVLDPFLGSGTTGIAAVLEGRHFIGIEKVPHFAELAAERIRAAALGWRDDPMQLVLDEA